MRRFSHEFSDTQLICENWVFVCTATERGITNVSSQLIQWDTVDYSGLWILCAYRGLVGSCQQARKRHHHQLRCLIKCCLAIVLDGASFINEDTHAHTLSWQNLLGIILANSWKHSKFSNVIWGKLDQILAGLFGDFGLSGSGFSWDIFQTLQTEGTGKTVFKTFSTRCSWVHRSLVVPLVSWPPQPPPRP